MPRYELVGGGSAKFWEVDLQDASVTARWGRVGTLGQSKTQRFSSAETAEHECDLLIRSKEDQGYQLVSGPDEVDRLVVRLDDGRGWWRELELRGTTLTQRARTSDDEPNESSTRFENDAEAKDQFDFLISRYLKQGYTELSRGELAALFLGGKAQDAWERLKAQRDALLGPYSEQELFDLVITNGFLTGTTSCDARALRGSPSDTPRARRASGWGADRRTRSPR